MCQVVPVVADSWRVDFGLVMARANSVTTHLYYSDSYMTHFEAVILQALTVEDRPAIILDQSAFYPTGGGQPHDTGELNGIPVVEVIKDRETNQILHILQQPLQGDSVMGQINWPRRFDLMQQHTGQHILSQAILETVDAATVGFHLSREYATIDIARTDLNETSLFKAEQLANRIIYDNRPVTARFVSRDELDRLPLRKPPSVAGPVRVVTIEDFDWSACGGTHVAQTGEIGMIKIVKTERRKDFLRLTFLCGERTLRHYHQINDQIREIALWLTVSVDEALEAIQRQSEALKKAQKDNESLKEVVLTYEAQALLKEAIDVEGVLIINRLLENKTIDEARQLAQLLVQQPKRVTLFGLGGEKGQLIFARSSDVALDMPALLRLAGKLIGGGGGGSLQLAQGGGPYIDKLPAALAEAQAWVTGHLSAGE